jgi:hypothetical protein
MSYPSQNIITVCDKCLTETCYQNQFLCPERAVGQAGSITDTEEYIARLPTTEDELVFEVERTGTGLESHGPFQQHKLTIDGYRIPYMTGLLKDGRWHFTLDERFGADVPEQDGHGVAWLIANALAFGAGYSCFGKNSQPLNMFKTQLHCITGTVPEIEALQPENEVTQ